jgi:hypothetical protein
VIQADAPTLVANPNLDDGAQQCRVSLRLATTFPARMGVYRGATPAQQGKCPTPRTPRCDKPLGRVKSFRTSQHRRRALTERARNARVTWVVRSLRGVRRSMHREPREVNPSLLPVRIAKAPVPALDRQPIPQDHRSSVGRPHGLHREGRCSTRFAKCQLCRPRSHRTLPSNVRLRRGKASSRGGIRHDKPPPPCDSALSRRRAICDSLPSIGGESSSSVTRPRGESA